MELLWHGIEFALVRRKDHVDAERREPGEIGVEGARIAVEVLRRAELQTVHEDAHDHALAVAAGNAHQIEMSFVQIAHGRHERDPGHAAKPRAQRGNGGDHVHRRGN